ncbi:retrovirus-related pol polyprotein from transposon gypsy [Plakobranchus ocellatus]|uniref:Retrovirus-related pol polyprotein from transposon gypsy n=1 Tax=Plakobranchus ocellatus TaxID=259542 RepID=A0AAV4C404_9GAST|nr:retrovirus-related pol polyprotein from transposon gypsy [Plakobranchus ocellatus]
MQPLQNMLKKDVPFIWSDSQEKAFQAIKQAIIDSPTLAIYDPAKELVLENDASEYGVGSVLLQDGKPLAFASFIKDSTACRAKLCTDRERTPRRHVWAEKVSSLHVW